MIRAIPLEDRLVCRECDDDDSRLGNSEEARRTAAGLYRIDKTKPRATGVYLEVLAIGPGEITGEGPGGETIQRKPPPHLFEPGDVVCASNLAGLDIELDGKKLRVVQFADVFFVVQPAGPAENSGKVG